MEHGFKFSTVIPMIFFAIMITTKELLLKKYYKKKVLKKKLNFIGTPYFTGFAAK
jgi:hypothetical protein